MKIAVQVDGQDLEVEVAFDKLSLKEQVLFQKTIGTARYAEWVGSDAGLAPDVIDALIFIGLRRHHPDLTVDEFDVDAAEVLRLLGVGGVPEENPTSGS